MEADEWPPHWRHAEINNVRDCVARSMAASP